MKKPPLHLYRMSLNMKSVHIQCLNEHKDVVKGANASGFIIREKEVLYLYTCWHVVTGYDMHDIKIGTTLPNRKYFELNLQNCANPQEGIQVIGGNQSAVIPLYSDQGLPLWVQNKQDIPNPDLNNINLKVPFWHDAIKLPLPESISVSNMQIIDNDDLLLHNSPLLGEKIYIVGYPYGYSAFGMEQPTPIVLTRFLAADRIKGRQTELLLDGAGAPGMSGGPTFVERDNRLYLFGLYTGIIYPDYLIEKKEKSTALGSCCNLVLWWSVENE